MKPRQHTICSVVGGCSIFGGPCPSCHCDHCDGTGGVNDGDPETGDRMIDCQMCGGTGRAVIEGEAA